MKANRTRLLATLAVAALLNGCGGALSPFGLSQPTSFALQPSQREATWMSLRAGASDLLYAADQKANEVYVYAYPPGPLVGTLTGFSQPGSPCVDAKGDVFVPDGLNARIVEFAHGGTKPISVLKDSGQVPAGCSVDLTTGDLAVANFCEGGPSGCPGSASVSVYRSAKGAPEIFKDPQFLRLNDAAYDHRGNLYVDGYNRVPFQLFELLRGSKAFERIKMHWTHRYPQIKNPGGVQWVLGRLLVGESANEVSGPSIYVTSGSGGRIFSSFLPRLNSLITVFQILGHRE